jgi:hypothetical protein
MDFKNIKKKNLNPDVSRLLPKVCDFQIENHTLGYGFKNPWKIYSLAYRFFICCDFHLWIRLGVSVKIFTINVCRLWLLPAKIAFLKSSLDMSALGFIALFSVTRRDMGGGRGEGEWQKGGGGEVQMFPGSDVCSWASFSLVFPRVAVPNTPRLFSDGHKYKEIPEGECTTCRREVFMSSLWGGLRATTSKGQFFTVFTSLAS